MLGAAPEGREDEDLPERRRLGESPRGRPVPLARHPLRELPRLTRPDLDLAPQPDEPAPERLAHRARPQDSHSLRVHAFHSYRRGCSVPFETIPDPPLCSTITSTVPDPTNGLLRRLAAAAVTAALALFLAAPAAGAPKSFAGQPSPANDESEPRVLGILSQRSGAPDRAGLNDRITLTVRELPSLLEEVDGNCAGLVLFLGGMPLKGLSPESCNVHDGQVRFLLVRTDAADEAWHALLGSPGDFVRPVTVSLGSTDSLSIPSNVARFPLVILPRFELYAYFAAMAGCLVVFYRLARYSDLLRSPTGLPGPDGRRPYSLSRF